MFRTITTQTLGRYPGESTLMIPRGGVVRSVGPAVGSGQLAFRIDAPATTHVYDRCRVVIAADGQLFDGGGLAFAGTVDQPPGAPVVHVYVDKAFRPAQE